MAPVNDTITAVPGLTAGHAQVPSGTSGCTVLRCDAGARAGLWVPGSAPGSREWGVLSGDHLAGRVHAVVLSGGSAFGLATADGVMQVLSAAGVGFDTGFGVVPIVPAAILFDLDQGPERPGAAEGAAAAEAASDRPLPTGRVGAGAGAHVGRGLGAPVRGGLGSAVEAVDAWTVGVVVAVNAFGAVVDPATGAPLSHVDPVAAASPPPGDWRGHTTLAAVATDAPLDRGACRVLAKMASAAFARCFRPAFTPFDGDAIVALSTAAEGLSDAATLARLGDASATALTRAITGLFRARRP